MKGNPSPQSDPDLRFFSASCWWTPWSRWCRRRWGRTPWWARAPRPPSGSARSTASRTAAPSSWSSRFHPERSLEHSVLDKERTTFCLSRIHSFPYGFFVRLATSELALQPKFVQSLQISSSFLWSLTQNVVHASSDTSFDANRCVVFSDPLLAPQGRFCLPLVLCPPFIILFVWKSVWPTSKPKPRSFSIFTVMASTTLLSVFTCLHWANKLIHEIHLTSLNVLANCAPCRPSLRVDVACGCPLIIPFLSRISFKAKGVVDCEMDLTHWAEESSHIIKPLRSSIAFRKLSSLYLGLCWFASDSQIKYVHTDGKVHESLPSFS